MRRPALIVALALPLATAGAVAIAQIPQAGTQAGGNGQASTPAPVPDVLPGTPGTAGSGVIPEQVAPPALNAGPANSTPFSSTPSGELPSDQSTRTQRDHPGGAGAGTPNLSR